MSGIVAYRDLTSEYWYAPPLREIVNSYYFQQNERLPQYLVEYALRKKLAELANVESRFGWAAETIEQDAKGARVTIAEEGGGAREVLEADYVVGCDGGHSIVRQQIGIERAGADFNQLMVLALFRSTRIARKAQAFSAALDLSGACTLISRAIGSSSAGSMSARAGSSIRRCRPSTTRDNYDFHGLLQRVAGFHFACEFDYVGFWDLRIAVADKYQVGRVFIAGDAAHSHPPYGGYGLNNGLDDVANLGWKIAAKLQGWGSDALLQSYSEERQSDLQGDRPRISSRPASRRTRNFSPATARTRIAPNSSAPGRSSQGGAAPRVLTYEPHYEGSPIVFGPARRPISARGTHTFKARAGHHLPPQLLQLRPQRVRGTGIVFHAACVRCGRPRRRGFC